MRDDDATVEATAHARNVFGRRLAQFAIAEQSRAYREKKREDHEQHVIENARHRCAGDGPASRLARAISPAEAAEARTAKGGTRASGTSRPALRERSGRCPCTCGT